MKAYLSTTSIWKNYQADVIGLAPMLDALVLVVEASRTTDKDVKKSISLLNGSLPIVGTILNKAG